MRRCLIGLLMLAACHQHGTGIGSLRAPLGTSESPDSVAFSWSHGADPSHGKIRARLSDGTELRGTFIQERGTIQVTRTDEYDEYVAAYGKTMFARLRSLEGRRMQCQFLLADPIKGLRRGADGKCMLSDQEKATYSMLVARIPD